MIHKSSCGYAPSKTVTLDRQLGAPLKTSKTANLERLLFRAPVSRACPGLWGHGRPRRRETQAHERRRIGSRPASPVAWKRDNEQNLGQRVVESLVVRGKMHMILEVDGR